MRSGLAAAAVLALGCGMAGDGRADPPPAGAALPEHWQWTASRPLVAPLDRDGDHYYSVKDPSFVQVGDRWHLFCTVRGQQRSHQIEYFTFTDWNAVDKGERHMLPITDNYFCAPTVFYFTPQKKWYLLYQYSEGKKDSPRLPGFSTNLDIGDWQHWTAPQPLYPQPGEMVKNWIDFWIICDDRNAYLFFTCDDGTLWRAQTALGDFPRGWSQPVLALRGDIFEASHTYHVPGGPYLTITEAIGHGRRYYQAYQAATLDGVWSPLAGTYDHPFAGAANVAQPDGHWTDSISHGELFRAGANEKMEIDPRHLRFLFQGVADADMAGKPYGQIPWRLGILSLARP